MFIGYRGTVSADPTAIWSGIRELSAASHLMLLPVNAGARCGLVSGCWGRMKRPECSPVASSLGSIGTFFWFAQVTLSAISELIFASVVHSGSPLASV